MKNLPKERFFSPLATFQATLYALILAIVAGLVTYVLVSA